MVRLSIRLQQHGIGNHPYWWIVVAPQKSNIFGRYVEHIGYWSPREGVNMKRQVIFNMPRLMYWISNGAIPTFKIHKFMSMWGLYPKHWYYKKSAAELAKIESEKPSEEEMTPKQKALADRKRKRREREALSPLNYKRLSSLSMFPDRLREKVLAKRHLQDYENDVLRDMLYESDFEKYDKLAQLSSEKDSNQSYSERLGKANEKIRKLRSELALIEKQYSNQNILLKSKLIQEINSMAKKIEDLTKEEWENRCPEDLQNEDEYVTEGYLDKKLKYELITKKFESMMKQIEEVEQLTVPITLPEFAEGLKKMVEGNEEDPITESEVLTVTEELYRLAGESGKIITKLDLAILKSEKKHEWLTHEDEDEVEPETQVQGLEEFFHQDVGRRLVNLVLMDDVALPTNRPVHPRPDLSSYIPEDHYEPIDANNLDIITMEGLDPHQEVKKYQEKKKKSDQVI